MSGMLYVKRFFTLTFCACNFLRQCIHLLKQGHNIYLYLKNVGTNDVKVYMSNSSYFTPHTEVYKFIVAIANVNHIR